MVLFALKRLSIYETDKEMVSKFGADAAEIMRRYWHCGYAGFDKNLSSSAILDLKEKLDEEVTYLDKLSPVKTTRSNFLGINWILRPDEEQEKKALLWVGFDTGHFNDPMEQDLEYITNRFRDFQDEIINFELEYRDE
jgi:hypothetical protein